MRILVITSCTGQKAVTSTKSLTHADFSQGTKHVKEREKELAGLMRPSEELYTGQQHVRLMRGIRAIRKQRQTAISPFGLTLWIVSAGYGIVSNERLLAPYECTFQGMQSKQLRLWADHLKLPQQFREVVRESYDLGLILLGDQYLAACSIDSSVVFGGPTLLFGGFHVASNVPTIPNLRSVALSNPETRTFRCGHVGLKGEVACRLLTRLSQGTLQISEIIDFRTNVIQQLASEEVVLSNRGFVIENSSSRSRK